MNDPAFDRTYVPVISGSEPTMSYSESTSDDKSWYLEGRIDYARKFGNHSVSGLVLYNQSRDYYPSYYSWLPRGYVGWVGRATYSYADKYLVDMSAGYNGSENFAPGKTRYGLFPSISLGWVLSEERFFKKLGTPVDFFKIRASVGKVGSDQGTSARFMYMEGVWNDAGSYYNYRLHFSGDIFKEHRTGILISPNSLPAIIATNLPNMNLGVVDNRGYEVELGWKDHIGQFTYDINANATFARNKIVNMDEVTPAEPYQAYTGGSTGRYMLYQFERLYQKSDFYIDENGVQRLNPDLPKPTTTVYPGDAMYADLNGDGVIDGLDMKVAGYPNRPEYVFGSNMKFGWKGFNLNLNWIAATNVSRVLNMDYRIPFTNSGHRGLLKYFADNCWIPDDNDWAPGREDGTLPRFTKLNYPWNSQNSTLWTQDASYIRLKSASFGYTFSRNRFFDKLGISSLGIMFTGYNLLTFSHMTIQDPEAKSSDADGEYPLVKTYNMAININF